MSSPNNSRLRTVLFGPIFVKFKKKKPADCKKIAAIASIGLSNDRQAAGLVRS